MDELTAIRILEDNKPRVIFEDDETQKRMAEIYMALEAGIEALRYRHPQKPLRHTIEYTHMPDIEVVQCPSCTRRLRTQRGGTIDKYCPSCGQAINWEV